MAKEKGQFLYDFQMDAVNKMKNGCILNGGVGSGKSRTSLYYYFKECGGSIIDQVYTPMKKPFDLYIITTAMKRNKNEWNKELAYYRMSTDPEMNLYDNTIVVDSWNNIGKYVDVSSAFFIFDEDRVTGSGAWVKSFYKIVKKNKWIILSATPGDTWEQYIPVFVANGFYRNKTEFCREHVVYNPRVKFPLIDRYLDTGRLLRLRNSVLIDMDFARKTIQHHDDAFVKYDISLYKDTIRSRTNPYVRGYIPCRSTDIGALKVGRDIKLKDVNPILPDWNYTPKKDDYVRMANKPLTSAAELCYTLRKIVNSDESRQVALLEYLENKDRAIIFYNFDYELDILLNLEYGDDVVVAQWNGHMHQPIPESEKWIYLVNYAAGAEGWECIKTDTIIFYSQNYSYKVMLQASGRTDRLNTPYKDLYYYHLRSRSGIDLAISKALREKKKFNEARWVNW